MANEKSARLTKAAFKQDAPAAPVLLSGGNPQIAKGYGDGPVQAYIAAMPGWKRHVGELLDRLIVRAVPQVSKAVKWNSPFYGSPLSGWFLSFHCYAKYVKVAFFNGTLLHPLPPGKSKQAKVRYVDLHEGTELNQKQFSAWVAQASTLPGWQMASPNPSIERTSSGRLRLPTAAAHVKR
jgi:hypothetical protein